MICIAPEAAGESRLAMPIDHVAFEASQLLDEHDACAAHGKSGGGKAIRFVYIWADDCYAHDFGKRPLVILWVINMLPADLCS
jgi:hypothetical protein